MMNAFRDGRVHICASMCATCIYRKGSPLYAVPIKRLAVDVTTAVICHSTLGGEPLENAVCAGFYKQDSTPLLRLAARMRLINWVKPKEIK